VVWIEGEAGIGKSALSAFLARLADLDVHVRSVLRLAALLGVGFDVGQLAAISGLAVRELVPVLAAAQEAGVLEPTEERLVFRHVLIQQVLSEQTPEPVRRALHKEIALTLAGAGAGPGPAWTRWPGTCRR